MTELLLKNKILVVGGAGYIGSHMVKYLARLGFNPIVFDNLSTGHGEAARFGKLIVGDLGDIALLNQLFKEHQFIAVMHFAAVSIVEDSIASPAEYYKNNVSNTIKLLNIMMTHCVKNFVFSSTASIFGEPVQIPINEAHPKHPINPYGRSKLMIEQILNDYASAYGMNSVCLRYFNASGADPEGDLGELHDPETHLIPLILQVASGQIDSIKIFGDDYPTHDGTCIRDYIHVVDLCQAHHRALLKLLDKSICGAQYFNLGNGNGFSVKEVIDTAKQVVKINSKRIKVETVGRRGGDPAVLVADASAAIKNLKWEPKYSDLTSIIKHSWCWERKKAGLV